uniref:Uncharacterized protein n=1 Tax=Ananas comosus var. bracteatus TaxID=296719 RepID=A0A6V7QKF9_ANACO|nr:unnamed protein product [Ananas comosus var. bracteatus]
MGSVSPRIVALGDRSHPPGTGCLAGCRNTVLRGPVSPIRDASLLRPASGGTTASAGARDGCGRGEEYGAHLRWRLEAAAAAEERTKLAQDPARVPRAVAATAASGALRDDGGRSPEAGGVPWVRSRVAATQGRNYELGSDRACPGNPPGGCSAAAALGTARGGRDRQPKVGGGATGWPKVVATRGRGRRPASAGLGLEGSRRLVRPRWRSGRLGAAAVDYPRLRRCLKVGPGRRRRKGEAAHKPQPELGWGGRRL